MSDVSGSPLTSLLPEIVAGPFGPELSDAQIATLPPRPGVCAFEEPDGTTLSLSTTADLRRRVRERCAIGHRFRIAPSALGRIRFAEVGCAFEADWLYLRAARIVAAGTWRQIIDRWRPWFVHVDPGAPFPRFTKTTDVDRGGRLFGPIGDKHAAQRFIERIERGFDLCRHHHLLVLAPEADACVYKEMGQCPAPCDGTVSMAHYRRQIEQAVAFVEDPAAVIADLSGAMRDAAGALEYEHARQLKRRLEHLEKKDGALRAMRAIEHYGYVAIARRPDGALQLFACAPDSVQSMGSLPHDADDDRVEAIVDEVAVRCNAAPAFDDAALGLVAHHLFRRGTPACMLIPAADPACLPLTKRGLRTVSRRTEDADSITDRDLDSRDAS